MSPKAKGWVSFHLLYLSSCSSTVITNINLLLNKHIEAKPLKQSFVWTVPFGAIFLAELPLPWLCFPLNEVNNSKHRILLLQVIGELETQYWMTLLLWRRTSQNLNTQSLQLFLHIQLSPTKPRILPATNNQETEGRCACDSYNEKSFPWNSFKAQHRSTATRETARENPRTCKMLAHSFTCPKHIKRHTVVPHPPDHDFHIP